jgi:hypothetical protein
MNSTSTPSGAGLDSFESALLGELRAEVTRAASVTQSPRRGTRRWLRPGLAALAATAAGTAVVIGLGVGPGSAPAYAVSHDASGDIVVTVHELRDAAGLESALRADGIDAEVTFDARPSVPGKVQFPMPDGGIDTTGSNGRVGGAACGAESGAVPTLQHDGSDWVLTVPGGSPLMTQPVGISADAAGDLTVGYTAEGAAGVLCLVVSST